MKRSKDANCCCCVGDVPLYGSMGQDVDVSPFFGSYCEFRIDRCAKTGDRCNEAWDIVSTVVVSPVM